MNKYIDVKIACDLSNVAGALWNPESEVDFEISFYRRIPLLKSLVVGMIKKDKTCSYLQSEEKSAIFKAFDAKQSYDPTFYSP